MYRLHASWCLCVCSLSFALLPRPPSAREHFFPDAVRLLFYFSISVLFPLRSFRLRARIHSFALCPACFSLVRSVVLLLICLFFVAAVVVAATQRSCLVSSFLFGSAERALALAVTYHQRSATYQTLTRSRFGYSVFSVWSVSLYFVIGSARVRSTAVVLANLHTFRLVLWMRLPSVALHTISYNIDAIWALLTIYSMSLSPLLPMILFLHRLGFAHRGFIRYWIRRARDVWMQIFFISIVSIDRRQGSKEKRIYRRRNTATVLKEVEIYRWPRRVTLKLHALTSSMDSMSRNSFSS